MRNAKERKRIAGPAPDYPHELPYLRRVVMVFDFDFGLKIHSIKMYRTNRVDCFRVVADGKHWKDRIGWSGVLAGLRKALPRVGGIT